MHIKRFISAHKSSSNHLPLITWNYRKYNKTSKNIPLTAILLVINTLQFMQQTPSKYHRFLNRKQVLVPRQIS